MSAGRKLTGSLQLTYRSAGQDTMLSNSTSACGGNHLAGAVLVHGPPESPALQGNAGMGLLNGGPLACR